MLVLDVAVANNLTVLFGSGASNWLATIHILDS
jgi:hypothetical protein